MVVQVISSSNLMNKISFSCRFVVKQLVRMLSSQCSYEEAIKKLNKLQSNRATLDQIRKDRNNGKISTNIDDMINYLSRTGVSMSTLDTLSVIHIAGTKGKGSTSAMCESILRHHGYRTGFYSSPHLVEVRERIRLEGRIVERDYFSKHFHKVYDMLYNTQAFEGDMPKYFAFMTVLAFNMFIAEKVDVAIVEVGIGGIIDYTNVLRKVPVVGITPLGLDHTDIIGDTLPRISAAKAGIMKPGCLAYTVKQPPEALAVLKKVADKTKCPLHIVPDYKTYKFPESYATVSPFDIDAYQMNASLAIQLAHSWLRKAKTMTIKDINVNNLINGRINNGFHKLNGSAIEMVINVPPETAMGLRACKWPGRFQVIQTNYAEIYLDGAHTKESIEICSNWFEQKARGQDKILIFCATGNRDAELLLKPLKEIHFKTIFFVVPTAYKEINMKNDNYTIVERNESLSVCYRNAEVWKQLCEYRSEVVIHECVSYALLEIERRYNINQLPSVLITGSLHLVGAAISILDTNFAK